MARMGYTGCMNKREIKFRAWLKNPVEGLPRMVPWSSDFFSDSSEVTAFGDEFPEPDGDVVLMQYTGLKDKNGREIYEGDIVASEWGDWESGYVISVSMDDFYNFVEEGYSEEDIEVFGNIYENPKLIRGKAKRTRAC